MQFHYGFAGDTLDARSQFTRKGWNQCGSMQFSKDNFLTRGVLVRTALISLLVISVGVGDAFAQTTAPPAAAPAPAAPAAPAAPPSGAPAIGATPGTPSPSGLVQPPTPSINSTPSGANVDLYPPSRLTTPGGPAGPPTPGQVTPGTPPLGQTPQGSGARPQPGGANTTAPAKEPKKTGNDYSLAECMVLWDAGTHMTKGQWRAACQRVQNRLNNLEVIAEETGTKKTNKKRQSGLGVDRRSAN